MNRSLRESSGRREAFTLLELLMVIAVISILMTLVFAAMNSMTENAEFEATKVTVTKLSRLLDQRSEAFDRAFKGARKDAYIRATVALLTAIDSRFDFYRLHPEKAPATIVTLSRKAAFRFEFPQRMAELIIVPGDDANNNGLPDRVEEKVAKPNARAYLFEQTGSEPTAAAVQALVNSRWTRHKQNVSAGTDKTESSELLYYFLTASGTFGTSPVDVDQFSVNEVRDTDEDGLPEFVDAWGEPLRFYRWPTRLIDPTAPNPFSPDFTNTADPTDVDLTPDENEGDGLREITSSERLHAGLLIRGLPPAPTQLVYTSASGVSTTTPRDSLLVDPDDPAGLLYTFIEDPQYKGMSIDLTKEYNEVKYHTPDTYHVPLIVSAGPDGDLGLREPNDTNFSSGIFGNLAQYAGTTTSSPTPPNAVVDMLTDNITNRNRRAGGNK